MVVINDYNVGIQVDRWLPSLPHSHLTPRSGVTVNPDQMVNYFW